VNELIFASIGFGIYLAGLVCTGRIAFQLLRPHRTPACGKQHKHESKCYRRPRLDLTYHPYDTDHAAATAAIWIAVMWPLMLFYLLIVMRPPETEQETIARQSKEKEALERRITEQEFLLSHGGKR
jgi:hypothetical protein